MSDSIIYFRDHLICNDSQSTEILKKANPQINVIEMTSDFTKIENTVKEVEYHVKNKDYALEGFVGTGLGGFIANYFSNTYGFTCLIINPILDPIGYIEANNLKIQINKETIKMYYKPDVNGVGKIVLFGGNDHLVEFTKTYETVKGRYSIYINDEMSHTIENEIQIKSALNDLINNIII